MLKEEERQWECLQKFKLMNGNFEFFMTNRK